MPEENPTLQDLMDTYMRQAAFAVSKKIEKQLLELYEALEPYKQQKKEKNYADN